MDVCLLYVTVPNAEVATTMAEYLVEQQLAACVNVVNNVRSFYRWEGRVQSDAEVVLLVKTTTEASERTVAAIVERHPHELPCVLCFEPTTGHPPFLSWIIESVGPSGIK